MPPVTKADQEIADRIEQEKLLAAYRELFGEDEKTRTDTQIRVMADLEARGYMKRTTLVPDRNGATDPIRMAHAEGARSIVLYIQANIAYAAAQQGENTHGR
jgi:hypothetical protein